MADYYPLVSRAVAGLDKNTGEQRRALYERARAALVAQLRSAEPALNESEITRERLALEESIRKVEAEAAKRMRPDAFDGEEPRYSLRDHGLSNFRETAAEAETLGDAAAEASRSARASFEAVPGEHPPPPRFDDSAQRPAEHYFDQPYDEQFEQPPTAEPRHEPEQYRRQPASYDDEDESYARPPRSWGRVIKYILFLLVIAGLAGGGYWKRNTIMSMVANYRNSQSAPKTTAQPTGRPKIADRIGAAGEASTANAPAAAVAQKVVLYDEDPNDPQGKRYVGSAVWRTETVSPGPGLAPELAIRADVEIPDRRMRVTWSLRRNTDKALPASHTIEIMFSLPPDFPNGGISNIPGILMKQAEQTRGVPLAGLAVKVTTGFFLIGLSSAEADVQRNIQLLKERAWFDVPVVYANGRRAIMAIEKGEPGQRAFADAFAAWGE